MNPNFILALWQYADWVAELMAMKEENPLAYPQHDDVIMPQWAIEVRPTSRPGRDGGRRCTPRSVQLTSRARPTQRRRRRPGRALRCPAWRRQFRSGAVCPIQACTAAFTSALIGCCAVPHCCSVLRAALQVMYNLLLCRTAFCPQVLYEETKGEAVVTTGVGQHQMWAAQVRPPHAHTLPLPPCPLPGRWAVARSVSPSSCAGYDGAVPCHPCPGSSGPGPTVPVYPPPVSM